MELGKGNMKKIKGLILFAGIVVLVLLKFDMLVSALKLFLQMLSPFIMGGAMAFILNLPMRFYEKKLFRKQYADQRKQNKYEKKKEAGLSDTCTAFRDPCDRRGDRNGDPAAHFYRKGTGTGNTGILG